MPLVIAALEQIPAGFEGKYLRQLDNSNALGLQRAVHHRGVLRSTFGKFQRTWLWLTTGNSCPASSSLTQAGISCLCRRKVSTCLIDAESSLLPRIKPLKLADSALEQIPAGFEGNHP